MILIDYYAVAIGNVVAHHVDTTEELLRHTILNSIRSYRKKHFAEYGEVVICLEGRKNWRKEFFPPYKQHRQKDHDASATDWNKLFEIITKVADELRDNFPYKVVKVDECEADDIIAELVESTQEFGCQEPVIIISGDKDFAQLQKYPNVKQWSPVQSKYIKEAKPYDFLNEHILRGDKGDGVPNVLSADTCFTDGVRQTPLSAKVMGQLIKDPKCMGESVYRNYIRNQTLIDLSKSPEEIRRKIMDTYNSIDTSKNKGKVLNYLMKNRCRKLMECAGDFTHG
jgi:hypothetical protein